MNKQVFSLTGKIVGIEEALNKNDEAYYKVKVAHGDREILINCNDKPGALGEEVTIPYTESAFTSPRDGKEYKSKWQARADAVSPGKSVMGDNETMVLLSMNRKLDEILNILKGGIKEADAVVADAESLEKAFGTPQSELDGIDASIPF